VEEKKQRLLQKLTLLLIGGSSSRIQPNPTERPTTVGSNYEITMILSLLEEMTREKQAAS
jgi:hypothetical protein